MKDASLRRLNFAALSAWVTASIFMVVTALLWYGQDFRGYYAAARVVFTGGNPYDYHELASVLLVATGSVGSNPYYYAPWFAWFLIPFGWLSFDIARGVWMCFNLLLWSFSLWKLSTFLNWPKADWRRWLLYLLATYVFAQTTWRYEQAGILLFALLLGVLFSFRNKKHIMTGVWLAFLLIKPNITLIPVTAICFWLIRNRNWRPVISMGTTVLGLLVISLFVTPGWYFSFFEPDFFLGLVHVLDGPEQVSTPVDTQPPNLIDDMKAKIDSVEDKRIYARLLGIVELVVEPVETLSLPTSVCRSA